MTRLKPPIVYLGSKTAIAPKIVELLPKHRHYVEPFAGSLAVLLAKPPSQAETVNDLDGDLMCFWRVLRDQPEALERACLLTPHSRTEYYASIGDLADLPDLERARRVWVRIAQGSSRTLKHGGMWARYVTYRNNDKPLAAQLRSLAAHIHPAAERLADVSLDSRPALAMVTKYGRAKENLLYLDPPYVETTRAPGRYRHEMASVEEHTELLEAALACKSAVAISGYPSDLYDTALAGWHRYEIASRSGGRGTPLRPATEVLWINRSAEGVQL